MYKAIHILTGEEIIILHPNWRKRISELRVMDRADLLVCQGCRQPMRVKAGEQKRPHFAHKHLQACTLGEESPRLALARAVLYGWLIERFPPALVTLEKVLPNLPRPVDGWVELPGGALAYWLVEAGIKLEPREVIKSALSQPVARTTWVMFASLLNEEAKRLQSVLLTPTERAFLQPTPFDEPLSPRSPLKDEAFGSLHYLDAEGEMLTSYRALTLVHPPNWFQGVKKRSPLRAVSADPETGGFAHPGEGQRLQEYRRKQQRLAEKRQRFERLSTANPPRNPGWELPHAAQSEPEPLPCANCGQITTNYWSTFYQDGRKLCRCRECLNES